MITLTDRWQRLYPEGAVGIIALRDLENPASHPALEAAGRELALELKQRYRGMDRPQLRQQPVFAAYDAFYRNFRKTYHVQLQLESVIHHDKPIQAPSTLVGAMFLAELETGLLTAVHDLQRISLPLRADVAQGGETYQRMDGSEQALKKGDMYIRDQQGVVSSVIYGPDYRTRIRPETTSAIFTTYGPPGIHRGQIQSQLERIQDLIRLIAPAAQQAALVVLPEG